MLSRSESKMAATCALAGSIVLFIGTYLHPLAADPNEAVATFSEYAADRLWVASHLTQLAGVVLLVAALLFLAQQLEAASGTGWARIAAGGGSARLAGATAVPGVDRGALWG